MFKKVTKLLGAIALTGWMGVANATLIFDFSWDSSNGKIIGEIYGLSDDGVNMEATGLVLTSVGGTQVDINVFEDIGWDVPVNYFDVLEGQIVGFDFSASAPRALTSARGALLRFYDDRYNGTAELLYRTRPRIYAGYGIGTFVKRATVPEPSSVILMLLGLAGLSFARYRKQY
jgi:hypothetical protein